MIPPRIWVTSGAADIVDLAGDLEPDLRAEIAERRDARRRHLDLRVDREVDVVQLEVAGAVALEAPPVQRLGADPDDPRPEPDGWRSSPPAELAPTRKGAAARPLAKLFPAYKLAPQGSGCS
jgi:hypothetical protein